MSLSKSAARRLSLLAGSSLIAGLSTAASIGLTALPTAALAQSVCTPAPTSGAGTNTVTYSSGFQSSGITCTATGLLTINAAANAATQTGAIITVTSTGGLILNNTGQIGQGPDQGSQGGIFNFSGVTGGGVTFNSTGQWSSSGTSVFSAGADTMLLAGTARNRLDDSSLSFGNGADTLTVTSLTTTFGYSGLDVTNSTISFGAGADAMTVTSTLGFVEGGLIDFGADADTMTFGDVSMAELAGVTLDFGTGADALNQNGRLMLNGTSTFSNLEAFNNAAPILLGGTMNTNLTIDFVLFKIVPTAVPITDGVPDDVLRMTNGTFNGLAGSRIYVDANLGTSGSQLSCATPTVADCANFTGASTSGETLINVSDLTFSIDGGTLGAVITVVEGATAAAHFRLDPASRYYAEGANGQAIRKPVVEYLFTYDDNTKRHVLVGAPGSEMFEVGTYAASAQEIWRATSGSWLTRQSDLRATPAGLQSGGSVWGRVGGQSGQRDLDLTYQVQGVNLEYDLTHQQRIAHVVFGADFLGASSDDSAWVVGAMVGYARSDVEFDATPTEAVTTGFAAGLYASYLAGSFFVDGVFNANVLHMTVEAPAMNLGLDVPMKFDVKSLGGQVEAGVRLGMGSGFFVEPLAGVSYIVTRIEDTEVPGGSGQFDFENSTSLRLGAGARVGLDSELAGLTAGYSLTARYWDESDGGLEATVSTPNGSSAALGDEFGGGFSELNANLSLYSDGGAVSGFVSLGGKYADGYRSVDGGVGVRVRW